VRRTQGLGPEDDPFIAKAELEAAAHSLMLVGHLPHLGRLASLLLTGNSDSAVVELPTATIVCLSRERGKWRMRWTLSPEA
jgi:phosphohistidine phosphatase